MRSALKTLVVAAVAVVSLSIVAALVGLPGLPSFGNPLEEQTVVRDHDVVVRALDDLSEYHAATGEYQVVVDVERDTRFVPSFLKGERTTFLAQGSVDAVVDLGALDPEHVLEADDGSVTVVLPRATLADPVIDHEASGVLDRDRGLVDRIGGVFSDSPTSEEALYLEAESRLAEAASDSELLLRARTNTESMIRGLLGAAGIDHVRIVFEAPGTQA